MADQGWLGALGSKVTERMIWALLATLIIFILFVMIRSLMPGYIELGPLGRIGSSTGSKADLDGGDILPAGAVVAFDLKDGCPPGWNPVEDAAGRTIVGTGTGAGLSVRNYRDRGGEERHLLEVAEMPRHSHALIYVPDKVD